MSKDRDLDSNLHYQLGKYALLRQRIEQFAYLNNFGFVKLTTNVLDKQSISSIKNDVIIACVLWELVPSLGDIKKVNQTLRHYGKKLYLFTDCIVDDHYNRFDCVTVFSVPECMGICADNRNYSQEKTSDKKRLYNCFMQRVDSVRQSWLYKLSNYNLLDQGHVSFLLFQLEWHAKVDNLFEYNHFNYGMDKVENFHTAFLSLKDRVPFKNFDSDDTLEHATLNSKYSLVLETYAVDDNRHAWLFTEKTLRSLQIPNLDLIFCQKNGYKILSDLGFECTDFASADHLPWQQRQDALLDVLLNDKVHYDDKLERAKAAHNQEILLDWKTKVLSADFFNSYIDKIRV